jgi:hypothetical protein
VILGILKKAVFKRDSFFIAGSVSPKAGSSSKILK